MFDHAQSLRRSAEADPRFGGRRAFTLLEAMVAIGAMALVSVGLAAIFSSVGKTITGGKRLSTLNTYAALVEQQMRRDFEAMSRDGYLMIRNQYTTDGTGNSAQKKEVGVSLLSVETPRPRRIDELMFFAKGAFSTAREATDPDFGAKSTEARIYYGHGTRLPDNYPAFIKPGVADANARSSASNAVWIGLGDPFGPNEYAGSWMLLRHVTLLARPESTAEMFPSRKVFQWDPATARAKVVLRDKVGQVGLHPAASSLFRVLAGRLPATSTSLSRDFFREEQNRPANRPLFTSGIVDLATTDLNEVRTIVSSVTVPPLTISQNASNFQVPNPPRLQNNVPLTQEWMEEGWPAYSDATAAPDTRTPPQFPGTRLRYEPAATNYIGVLTSYNTPAKAGEGAYRRADQMMLTASNFVPNCSEFIVEWSFGDVDPDTNDILWHGIERLADTDGDGVANDGDRALAVPYPLTYKKKTQSYTNRYTKFDGTWATYSVPATLIYNRNATPLSEVSQTAYFGYLDPTKTDSAPWPWPKLIRVIFTLADPNDAGVQQTFQFLFETPGARS
ncbi:MAG: hypothetical protein IT434_09450 [Phycisphaerales bacterium]|jgi:type II secretory pathway pseudopilin PulG|nr:hypothetical protein [Phycisphaerales bacterium]